MLFRYVFRLNTVPLLILTDILIALLVLRCMKNRKINTVAVPTGAAGYVLLYTLF